MVSPVGFIQASSLESAPSVLTNEVSRLSARTLTWTLGDQPSGAAASHALPTRRFYPVWLPAPFTSFRLAQSHHDVNQDFSEPACSYVQRDTWT
jgi:hypothetical protein